MTTNKPMRLGVVGLGRMGANIVRRLMHDGHSCVVFDLNPDPVKKLQRWAWFASFSFANRSIGCRRVSMDTSVAFDEVGLTQDCKALL